MGQSWEAVAYLNVFQFCKCLKMLGNVMVLFVVGIVGFTWWAVVPLYARALGGGAGGSSPLRAAGAAVVVVGFTALTAMVLWAYLAAVATDPGRVPDGWSPFADEATAQYELERATAMGPSYGSSSALAPAAAGPQQPPPPPAGAAAAAAAAARAGDRRDPRRPRHCKHCRAWKPERAHHCSVLGRCVLKMDHYCIWVVNCVGLLNYKFFLQFLAYGLLGSAAAVALMIQPMVDFLKGSPGAPLSPTPFIVVVMDGAFAAALTGFIGMHWSLLAHGCTTIEMYEKERPEPWPYDRGLRRNAEDVLGRSRLSWLLPRHTPEERARLLDSCLGSGQRLLHGGSGSDAV